MSLFGCAAGDSEYNSRFFEKYLLDAERARQESELDKAEKLAKQSIVYAQNLGVNDWRVAVSEARTGRILFENNKPNEARTTLLQAVAIFEKYENQKDVSERLRKKEFGEALALLGTLEAEHDQKAEARLHLEKANSLLMPYWEQASQDAEKDTIAGQGLALSRLSLGKIFAGDGDTRGATREFESALMIIDKQSVSVPMREDIAESLSDLLKKSGKPDEAREVLEKQAEYTRFNPGGAKAIARDLWRSNVTMAREATHANKLKEASDLLEKALSQTNKFQKNGEESVQTLCELARLRQRQGDHNAAIELLKRAETAASNLGGPVNYHVDNVLNSYSKIYRMQKLLPEQEAIILRQLKLRKELRGDNTFHVGETLNNLALCQLAQDRYLEAESNMEKALRIFELQPKEDARYLKGAYEGMIEILEKQHKSEQAQSIKKKLQAHVQDMFNWKRTETNL